MKPLLLNKEVYLVEQGKVHKRKIAAIEYIGKGVVYEHLPDAKICFDAEDSDFFYEDIGKTAFLWKRLAESCNNESVAGNIGNKCLQKFHDLWFKVLANLSKPGRVDR